MSPSDRVKTVILVMMENRSFDHMLGHLSYQGLNKEVDGLQQPLGQYENLYRGKVYPVKALEDRTLPADLPHEWTDVEVQMDYSPVIDDFTMGGFVEAYANSLGRDPGPKPSPMGYFRADKVPITSFLARNFCTCDQWFSPLPSSTQPNRTLAFCGSTKIFDTEKRLITYDDILFDWLDRAGVRWRVYHDGLSFFTLYPQAVVKHVLGANFWRYEYFYRDMVSEAVAKAPQVIIVEPSYQDAPHFGSNHPNDNHAPLAIGWGEEFLRRTYQAITANPEKWAGTVCVIYYDEHGGFWDHVPPPRCSYTTKGRPAHHFESLGPRIPAIVISPFVKAGAVSHALLDHTSVLQFLAELFTPGEIYSEDVEERHQQGIESLSVLLDETPRAESPTAPSKEIHVQGMLGEAVAAPPQSPMAESFELATRALLAAQDDLTLRRFPELLQWQGDVGEMRE